MASPQVLRPLDLVSSRPVATAFRVSCDDCSLQASSACDDCIVSFLCAGDALPVDRASVGGVDVSDREAATLSLFRDAGMAPGLRHRRRW